MHVNFKIYKDSFISRASISDTLTGGKKVLSVTDNDATFKYLHSTWVIDPVDKVEILRHELKQIRIQVAA